MKQKFDLPNSELELRTAVFLVFADDDFEVRLLWVLVLLFVTEAEAAEAPGFLRNAAEVLTAAS